MVNKVILVGRLGADPEIRYTMEGKPVATLSIATNEIFKRDGERETLTEWHRLVAFGRLAEICGEYLNKGSLIYVEGKLRTRKFEDRQKQCRYITEIWVQNLQILSSRENNNKEIATRVEEFLPLNEEEDLPF